ncbi:MAG: histidine phosphatase family protein [Bdellovibrionota bacterium]
MKLYLVRHLPTAWNVEGKLQGTQDIPILPLTEETTQKIKTNKLMLSPISFDSVHASEKKRTIQTAMEYGYSNPEISPLLNEMNFGPFEGTLKNEAIQQMGKDFLENPFQTVLSDHYRDLEKNIRSFLELHRNKNNVLVFGHGSFIRGTKCLIEHGDLMKINSFPLSNNEIVVLSF